MFLGEIASESEPESDVEEDPPPDRSYRRNVAVTAAAQRREQRNLDELNDYVLQSKEEYAGQIVGAGD